MQRTHQDDLSYISLNIWKRHLYWAFNKVRVCLICQTAGDFTTKYYFHWLIVLIMLWSMNADKELTEQVWKNKPQSLKRQILNDFIPILCIFLGSHDESCRVKPNALFSTTCIKTSALLIREQPLPLNVVLNNGWRRWKDQDFLQFIKWVIYEQVDSAW